MDVNAALEAIAAGRATDPLAPVTVVAPSHAAALQLRRRLAEITPFAGVRFETLPRIAEILGAGYLATEGKEPLARPIGDYVCQQVARESRGILSQVSDLPGYPGVLRQIFHRLRRGGIRSAGDIAQSHNDVGHLWEVLRLYDSFRRQTAAFYDEEDLFAAAAKAIEGDTTGALPDLGAFYILPPFGQSAGAAVLLSALRKVSPAYFELTKTRGRPEHSFALAADPAIEAREAVREVLQGLRSGLSVHQIAIFHGADPSYRRLLREAFDSAQVPIVMLPGVPLIDTLSGRAALALALLPQKDYSRVAVLDFLSMAPLREWLPSDQGEVRAIAPLWDRLSREAGITHGLDRWSMGMDSLIARREESLIDERTADSESRRAILAFERDQTGNLRAIVRELARRLEVLLPEQPASTFVPAFKQLVDDYLRPDGEALDEVFQEIDQLGAVGAVGGNLSLEAFASAFAANLEVAAIRERGLGDGIVVADYRLAAGLDFQQVVLCGAFEGAFPAGPGAETLIPDAVWSQLRQDHPYIEDSSLRSERAVEAVSRSVAAAGSGKVVWCAPLYEAGGGREYYPSPAMVATAEKLDPSVRTATELRGHASSSWLRRSASPLAALLLGPTVHAGDVQLRKAVLQRREGADVVPGHPYWRPISMLRARRSHRFSEWDGNLAEMAGEPWLSLPSYVSPTSLERYGLCGFRYLCSSLLRLNVVEEPEEREVMDSAERGSLIHRVLEAFFCMQRARGRPGPREPWTDGDLDELLTIMDQELSLARRRGLTGLDLLAEHERRTMRADLTTFLEEDTAFRRETGGVPTDFEVTIGDLTLAGVTVRGFVDRIDRTPDGRRAWVIDYKSGGKGDFDGISDEDPFASGTKLQLPVYCHAAGDAEEVSARYWFITRKGDFSDITYNPTPDKVRLFERVIESIVQGITTGAFPAVPGDEDEYYGGFKNCKYCDFDRICSRRRDYEIAAKMDDVALSHWVAVARAARGEDRG